MNSPGIVDLVHIDAETFPNPGRNTEGRLDGGRGNHDLGASCRPPGPPHPGDPGAGPRRRAAPHPRLPRPCLDPDDRALRQVATSEIEDILQHIWVAGPAAPNPGELLSAPASPMARSQAEALMIDLSRASTPTAGEFCTYQPVVSGGACPWNLDRHSCGKFVLSGADLL